MSDPSIAGREAICAAYRRMLDESRREFCAFTRDLEPRWLGDDDVLESLKAFALRSPRARIRLTTLDVRPAVHDGHRLLELARRLSSKIEIRVPDARHHDIASAYAVADGCRLLYRPLATRAEGVWLDEAPRRARERLHEFEEVWALAATDPELRALDI